MNLRDSHFLKQEKQDDLDNKQIQQNPTQETCMLQKVNQHLKSEKVNNLQKNTMSSQEFNQISNLIQKQQVFNVQSQQNKTNFQNMSQVQQTQNTQHDFKMDKRTKKYKIGQKQSNQVILQSSEISQEIKVCNKNDLNEQKQSDQKIQSFIEFMKQMNQQQNSLAKQSIQVNSIIQQMQEKNCLLFERITSNLESKLQKIFSQYTTNIKQEGNFIDAEKQQIYKFIDEQTYNLQEIQKQILTFYIQLKSMTDQKILTHNLSINLDIKLNQIQVLSNGMNYDKIVRQLNNQICVLKRNDQEIIDIVSIKKSTDITHQALVEINQIMSINSQPKFISLDENRVLIDYCCFDSQNSKLIQQFEDNPISGCQLFPNTIIHGFETFGKIKISKWNMSNGQYEKSAMWNSFTRKDYQVFKIEKCPYLQYDNTSQVPIFMIAYDKNPSLHRIDLDLNSLKSSIKLKLGSKAQGFKFVDSQNLVTYFQNEISLINYHNGQILSQFQLDFQKLIIPKAFNIQSFPILIGFKESDETLEIIDIMKHGYEGKVQMSDYSGDIKIINQIEIGNQVNLESNEENSNWILGINKQSNSNVMIGIDISL